MLQRRARRHETLDAAARIDAWTRARFGLAADAVVMAAEVACQVPGCPPVETIVAFWPAGGPRHRFKVFKPIAEVVAEDLPYRWYVNALVDEDGLDLECC